MQPDCRSATVTPQCVAMIGERKGSAGVTGVSTVSLNDEIMEIPDAAKDWDLQLAFLRCRFSRLPGIPMPAMQYPYLISIIRTHHRIVHVLAPCIHLEPVGARPIPPLLLFDANLVFVVLQVLISPLIPLLSAGAEP